MKKIVLIKDCHLGEEGRVYNFPDLRSDYLVRTGLAKYKTEIGEPKQAVIKESTKPRKKKRKK